MIEYTKHYQDSITLAFDTDKHKYSVRLTEDSELVPVLGVTSVLKVIDKSAPLIWWAVGCMRDQIQTEVNEGRFLHDVGSNVFLRIEAGTFNKILDDSRKAHLKVSKKALDIGTIAHNWIEAYIKRKIQDPDNKRHKSLPMSKEACNSIEAFLRWQSEQKIKYIASERKIYSKKYDYAGTLDVEAYINKRRGIIDFKTSKAIYKDYELQLGAYIQARHEEDGANYTNNYIVRIGKDGDFEAQKLKNWRKSFRSFKYALGLYKSLKEKIRGKIK